MSFPALDRLGVRNFNGTAPANYAAEVELFKKQYLIEIIKRFNEKNIFASRVMKRSIPNGTGASFPMTGKTSAQFYIPGISGPLGGTNGLPQTEKTISLDRPIISDISISNFDELMAHVDVRAERSKQQGDALVRKCDKNLAQMIILTSRAASPVPGVTAGGSCTASDMATNPESIINAIILAAGKLASNDVPLDPEDMLAVFRPTQYFLLLESDRCVKMNYIGKDDTTESPLRTGTVPSIAGIPLDWSNNIPSTNITTAEAGALNTYQGDFSKTQGAVFHRDCVGTVQLLDIQFEMEKRISFQDTLFVAKTMTGNDFLRPEAVVEIAVT